MRLPVLCDEFKIWHGSPADVHVVTACGHSIPVHSSVLASGSSVLENMISWRSIHIRGAPHDAIVEFIRFLYAGEGRRQVHDASEAMKLYGVQLLVLAHAYRVSWLKRLCEEALERRVAPRDAIDVMKLARLCDAPRLHHRCLVVGAKDFAAVQRSEGWRFVQRHDQRLELEVLQNIEGMEQRRKRWRRDRVVQEMFLQLSDAMESLEHICTEGCTVVGPHDGESQRQSRGPCPGFRTCEALQFLIKHFATCGKKLPISGGCLQCKRMWQLFRLHSSLCSREGCKVPLCRHFKSRLLEDDGKENGDHATWRLLVRKVIVVRAMTSLAARNAPEQHMKAWERFLRKN